ncbi:hypothetical protein OG592_24770 [Streptomyces avidinii]|uniref:hypothetical protein n=1 Tax=Streptomyces avidinii TaxID=1895 RepID=UPI00386F25BA|nr:hypothetical protein OG592_24770 [Streptomyces avidinii]
MITCPGSLARIAQRQLNMATYHQLKQAGVPARTISGRSRRGGPWQRLLPRVYLLQTGPPDTRQQALSAVLYAAHPAADPLSASPDAYWPEEGVALEIDSVEYHYTRDAWQATLLRRLRLESRGVLVVSTTPGILRDRPADVIAALRAVLALGAARRTPPTATARGHAQLELPLPPPYAPKARDTV